MAVECGCLRSSCPNTFTSNNTNLFSGEPFVYFAKWLFNFKQSQPQHNCKILLDLNSI